MSVVIGVKGNKGSKSKGGTNKGASGKKKGKLNA